MRVNFILLNFMEMIYKQFVNLLPIAGKKLCLLSKPGNWHFYLKQTIDASLVSKESDQLFYVV